jgi:NUMOD3 motif-containing protein
MGGTETVLLTAKEHFIAHLLLTRMCKKPEHRQKMWLAFNMMSVDKTGKRYKSRLFDVLRPKSRKAFSEYLIETGARAKEKHPRWGKKHTATAIQKNRDSHMGKKLTEKHKQKLSIAFTGEKNHFFGKKHKESSLKRIGEAAKANKGRIWFTNGNVGVMAFVCPPGFYRGRPKKENV